MILYIGNKLGLHGYNPTSVETLGKKLLELKLEVITKSSKRNKLLRFIDIIFSILKYKSRKPVVLIDTYSTSAFWFAVASARLCSLLKLNYIPILRGGDLPKRLDKSKIISRIIFTKSYSNIAASVYLHTEFKKRALPSQIIHNYLELKNYPFTHRRNLQPNLLWVRSFHEIYNPLLALKVLKKISNTFPNAKLCMVGPAKDGTLEKCKQFAQENNLNVNFTGRLSKKEWISLSKNYDIFINTTNVDNTPVSVMEAMALGLPIVTTSAGGIPYLFENNKEGIMVAPNDVDEMFNAILFLLDNSDRASDISIHSRQKAEEWDWNIIGPMWKLLLEKALHSTNN